MASPRSTNDPELLTNALARSVDAQLLGAVDQFDVYQLQRYVKAREQGMTVLRNELLKIHAAAGVRARVGYWRVKQLLDQAADSVPLTGPVTIVYLVPDDLRPSHLALLKEAEAYVVNFSELERLRAAHQDNVWKVVAELLQL